MTVMRTHEDLAILGIIVEHFEGAEFAALHGEDPIEFQDNCGCYSEWTTDPCYLRIQVTTPELDEMPAHRHFRAFEDRRLRAEQDIYNWAELGGLEWIGCDCCERELHVRVILLPRKQ